MAYTSLDGASLGLETLDLGGPHIGRDGVGSRGVVLATALFLRELSSILLLQHVHWQASARGFATQATYLGTQVVCS